MAAWMIGTKTRGQNETAGASRRGRARAAGPEAGRAEAGRDPRTDPDPRGEQAASPLGHSPTEAARDAERRRAALYLDLWERHVAGAALSGRGVAAPWFSR